MLKGCMKIFGQEKVGHNRGPHKQTYHWRPVLFNWILINLFIFWESVILVFLKKKIFQKRSWENILTGKKSEKCWHKSAKTEKCWQKGLSNGWCSTAMFDYRRVNPFGRDFSHVRGWYSWLEPLWKCEENPNKHSIVNHIIIQRNLSITSSFIIIVIHHHNHII